MKRIRLLPLVIAAAVVLLGLKVAEITLGGRAKEGMAQEMIAQAEVDPMVTGSVGGGGHGEEKKEEGGAAPPPDPKNSVTPSQVPTTVSGEKPGEARPLSGQELLSEIEILQKLSERRKKLEEIERSLQMREDLLKASEDRIGKRVDELKTLEDKIGGAAVAKEEAKAKELTDLVKMYESMKAKDAARVFDKLDTRLAAELGRKMNPKKLGDIVAKMSAEQAEKLTVELANHREAELARPAERELPKIQGRGG